MLTAYYHHPRTPKQDQPGKSRYCVISHVIGGYIIVTLFGLASRWNDECNLADLVSLDRAAPKGENYQYRDTHQAN